jgi:hypothetical protein
MRLQPTLEDTGPDNGYGNPTAVRHAQRRRAPATDEGRRRGHRSRRGAARATEVCTIAAVSRSRSRACSTRSPERLTLARDRKIPHQNLLLRVLSDGSRAARHPRGRGRSRSAHDEVPHGHGSTEPVRATRSGPSWPPAHTNGASTRMVPPSQHTNPRSTSGNRSGACANLLDRFSDVLLRGFRGAHTSAHRGHSLTAKRPSPLD